MACGCTRLKIYLAGVIQGSKQGTDIHDQGYRQRLKDIILAQHPDAEVYCPVEAHPGSEFYGDDKGREVFFKHMNWPREVDVVVAYLPAASMGTAIEMWNARQAGRITLTISSLKNNWVIKYLSDTVFETIEQFETFVRGGGLHYVLGYF